MSEPARSGALYRSHLAIRIDALPPWSPSDTRSYWCPSCGYLTGGPLPSRMRFPARTE